MTRGDTPVVRRAVAAAALASLALIAGGCSDGGEGHRAGHEAATDESLGHVHGLGSDPDDGTLYAATHFGVFDLGVHGAGPPRRIADRWQDTMAFTVAGPGHFLASGHPDLQEEDLPDHLGLIESTDAAQTWELVALQGEADFHVLELAGDLLYGYDSLSGRLVVTEDRQRWRTVARTQVIDLAADPERPRRLLATTPEGLVRHSGATGAASPVGTAPPVVLVDWPEPDLLVGATGEGATFRSSDGGETWQPSGGAPGEVQALDATPGRWHLATSSGIYVSTDDGRTWRALSTRQP